MKVDKLVLDCSVTMAWCFEDERSEFTEEVLESMAHVKALVPAIWTLEVANVLLVAERKKRISPVVSANFWSALQRLDIIVEQNLGFHEVDSLMAVAREHDLSSYDASYLELAFREGVPLCSTDKLLVAAAKKLKISILSDSL